MVQDSDEPDYRADGTIAHDIAAKCLENNQDAWEFAATQPRFLKDHVEAVQSYIDFVLNRLKQLRALYDKVEMRVETKVTHPDEPNFYGTVDVYLLCYDKGEAVSCEVIDYKHGVGIAVDVEDNEQLKYYAGGVQVEHPEIRQFNLVIVQPRAFHRGGPIREWLILADDLAMWMYTTLLPGIKEAQSGAGKLNPGAWCRFCPVKIHCPALGAMARAASTTSVDMVVDLSDEALGYEFTLTKSVEAYTKAIYAEVSKRALSGCEGAWKIVKKKADRAWIPGYQAPRMSVPMTPAQAELRLDNGKALTAEFARVPDDPGVTVVGLSDKRPPVARSAIAFDGLVGED